jgi:hypothetical protein
MMDRAIDGLRLAHVGLTALAWIVIGMIDVEGGYAVLYGCIAGVLMAGCIYFLTRGSRARTIAVLAICGRASRGANDFHRRARTSAGGLSQRHLYADVAGLAELGWRRLPHPLDVTIGDSSSNRLRDTRPLAAPSD